MAGGHAASDPQFKPELADAGPADASATPLTIATTNLELSDDEAEGYDSPAETSPASMAAGAPKKRQRRNKPTLSCFECVERKTKCDRDRPKCLACHKRRTRCCYSDIANYLAKKAAEQAAEEEEAAWIKKDDGAASASATLFGSGGDSSRANASSSTTPKSGESGRVSLARSGRSLISLPLNTPELLRWTRQVPHSVVGTGSAHPFANFWTDQGGLDEVIMFMPLKNQTDLLVAKYFESVDPVYPMLHKESFYADYDNFWAMPLERRPMADPSLLALHFAVYALGTQFLHLESDAAKQQICDFYISAAHQSLRLSQFLSKSTLRTIEVMVLIAYFLMNDNKATDAWAFCGILVKLAYAMELHRDPDRVTPTAPRMEKTQRRKLWQAVFFQDTFFTVLLKLPPTTMFSDVAVDKLEQDVIEPDLAACIFGNPDSIIAAAIRELPPPNVMMPVPRTVNTAYTDRQFVQSMWELAKLVQRTICQPRALARPLVASNGERVALLETFAALYDQFPAVLTNTDPVTFGDLLLTSPRMARQSLFLRSNYWHCILLIQAESNELAGVDCDIEGAMTAGRIAVASFFDFCAGLNSDASVWWVFQHRAFEEGLILSKLLARYRPPEPTMANPPGPEPLYVSTKNDVARVLGILETVGSATPEMRKTRTEALRSAYESIQW